jgi:hypothetical protein
MLYSPSVDDVIVGKLMAVQTAISAFQKTTGLKLIANENWKKNFTLNCSQTAIKRHIKYRPPNYLNNNSVSHFMSIYFLIIAVYKEWIL